MKVNKDYVGRRSNYANCICKWEGIAFEGCKKGEGNETVGSGVGGGLIGDTRGEGLSLRRRRIETNNEWIFGTIKTG